MKLFSCPTCSQVVFYENVVCERCNHALGYEAESNAVLALEPAGGIWTSVGARADGRAWKYCANYAHGACNWLIAGEGTDDYCRGCRHNLTVPDLTDADNVARWAKIEVAKRRMIYTCMRIGLPLITRAEHPEGLGFAFLGDDPQAAGHVMTGHDDGLITIALIEADDLEREQRRTSMGEPYRTLLGHFRHEVGHWYWDRLVRDGGALEACRAVFGDDTEDYATALQNHYANGPKPNWLNDYVSSYAGAHAWEDFAETWAHYFHILDTLDTGNAFGLKLEPRVRESDVLETRIAFDVYDGRTSIDDIADAWLALATALNSLNRSMGQGDLYPFVLSATVVRKLGFIHDLVHGRFALAAAPAPAQAAAG